MKVTVVITLYNKEKFIDRAIQSVLHQTHSDWTLIIINDASTDHSLAKIEPYLKDRRIKCITLKRNLGQAHALNYALTLIETSHFIQLDADDWLDQAALGQMVAAAGAFAHAGLIYANNIVYWENEAGKIIKQEPIVLRQYTDRYDLLKHMNHTLLPRFYLTQAVRDIGGWLSQKKEDIYSEDVQILLRLSAKYPMVWLNQFLYHRRKYAQNIRAFETSRPMRWKYRYDLYNQMLREWGNEYRAIWKKDGDAYILVDLVPNK
ncbi:glycosyltransferase family 2 protein [Paenibacillus naphthalenovorans]|uniref:glycosyltransferase family 2 protein n=1 Tax=Paenibacillus naphthalenovorans TaxID=162209 RepID=UPI003D2BCDBF